MPATNCYKWLAKYYDRIFTDHRAWFDGVRHSVLGPILPRVESACDLACGTGRTALMLARQEIRMFAVDLSPEMCRLTRENARRARLPVRVLHADMRRFDLPVPVDLVLCEYDALNHVTRKSDLALVAKAVSQALRPCGHFYFDVNNSLAFQKLWPSTWFSDRPGVAVVMHGGYNSSRDMGWTAVEWFIREGRCWRRRREHVEEVCWTSSEIRRTLRAAGFDRIRTWDAAVFLKNNPVMRPGYRTFYLARKSRNK